MLENSHTSADHQNRVRARVAKERLEAADWVFRLLEEYELISGVELAGYLRSTLRAMQHRLLLPATLKARAL